MLGLKLNHVSKSGPSWINYTRSQSLQIAFSINTTALSVVNSVWARDAMYGIVNLVGSRPSWISNHMPCEVWDEITYPLQTSTMKFGNGLVISPHILKCTAPKPNIIYSIAPSRRLHRAAAAITAMPWRYHGVMRRLQGVCTALTQRLQWVVSYDLQKRMAHKPLLWKFQTLVEMHFWVYV